MKKFLKVFIIILLVLAVIGGTCYFFFRKLEIKNNNTGSIVEMLQSESKQKFDSNIALMNELVNSDSSDDRVELIVETSQNLDQIVFELSTYHIETNTAINNEKIAEKLRGVKSTMNLLNRMVEEYNLKKDSAYFNKHSGANDFYEKSCDYLVEYARLVQLINSNLKNVNKTSDLKFNMFDVYSNIVIGTFKETKQYEHPQGELKVVEVVENIKKINEIFTIEDSFIVTKSNQFSSYVNQFNQYYAKSDKELFALEFALNIRSATANSENTHEENATYILKLIFGI